MHQCQINRGILLLSLRHLAGQLLQIANPLIALVARLGKEYKQHLRLYDLIRLVIACLRLHIVVYDDHQVKVTLLMHGTKAVYAIERYHWREHLLGLVERVEKRSQYVASLFVARPLPLQKHENVLEK